MKLSRHGIVGILLGLIAALTVAFLTALWSTDVQVYAVTPSGTQEYKGSVRLLIEDIDFASRKLRSNLEVVVSTPNSTSKVDSVSVGLIRNELGGSDYLHFDSRGKTGIFEHYEVIDEGDPSRALVHSVEVRSELEMPLTLNRGPLLYPFDSYSFDVAIELCVNPGQNACLYQDNVQVEELIIDQLAFSLEQGLTVNGVLDNGRGRLTLRRSLFLRTAAASLLAMVLVFITLHLIHLPSPDILKNAFGYLAILWGTRALLVPKAIVVFPTLVDHVILSVFGIFFVSLLLKFEFDRLKEKGVVDAEASNNNPAADHPGASSAERTGTN